jgi:uncharacterized protein YjbJ (UPF0337 family)
MKKILIILALLVVLVIGGVIGLVAYGISQIDTIFERAIEQGGTYATGVETTVDSVDVAITKGTFKMNGLEIDNPEGYESDHFLLLGEGAVGVALNEASTTNIRIPEFRLSSIDVNLDKTGGKANYQAILDNLKRFESGSAGDKPESETSGPKVSIDKLLIEDVNVHLVGVPGLSLVAGDVAVSVPVIELQNVGGADGMTFGELTNLVIKTVLSAAVEAGGGVIPADMLGELTGGLGDLASLQSMGVSVVGDLGGQIQDAAKNISGQAEGAIENATEEAREKIDEAVDDATNKARDAVGGLGNLLGGDEDEDGGP